jgi:hypothetical protein
MALNRIWLLVHLLLALSSFSSWNFICTSLAWVTRFLHSTHVQMWILLGFTTAIWTLQLFLFAFRDSNETPCRNTGTHWACLGHLVFLPWIPLGMFIWWPTAYICNCFRNLIYYTLLEKIIKLIPWRRSFLIYIIIVVICSPVVLTTIGTYMSTCNPEYSCTSLLRPRDIRSRMPPSSTSYLWNG